MQTNADGVFAGGDVVVFPFPPRHNKKVNIPHWQMAHVHGECCRAFFFCISKAVLIYRADDSPPRRRRFLIVLLPLAGRVAALGMMGRPADLKTVPYFWSAMFGKTIRYAGRCLTSVSRLAL